MIICFKLLFDIIDYSDVLEIILKTKGVIIIKWIPVSERV